MSDPIPSNVKLIYANSNLTGQDLAVALQLPMQKPVLLVNGGAAGFMSELLKYDYLSLFSGMALLWQNNQITVIDGGTQSGIMKIMGEVRRQYRVETPLVGVCPAARVTLDEERHPHRAVLDSNHSHLVLTPGDNWGDETPTMFALAAAVAGTAPSLAILVDGGAVAKRETLWNVCYGREIIVMQGSGRLADEIAAAFLGNALPTDDQIATIVQRGRIVLFDPSRGSDAFASLLTERLSHA